MKVETKLETKPLYDESRSLLRIIFTWTCLVVSLISFAVIVVFWFTSLFENSILDGLVLRNGSQAFEYWQRPPVRLVYKVYIFNYTNVHDFEMGRASKLKVEELGPYIYRETLQRVGAVLANGTATYREKRSYQWEGGRPDDENIFVPNIPLFSAVAFSPDWFHLATKIGLLLGGLLPTKTMKLFIPLDVKSYLWGYDDEIFTMARNFHDFPFDKFGLLAYRNNVLSDKITIQTGENGLDRIGLIQRLNEKSKLEIWNEDECNRITGTDGSIFPPHIIGDPNAVPLVYIRDMCRHLSLRYDGQSTSFGIPTYRYKLPEDSITSTDSKDSCYCTREKFGSPTEKVCPPRGIFNGSVCNFGSPTLTSFPHFYAADSSVYRYVDGMKPQKKLHDTYVHLHQRLGVPMGGWSRLQMNLEVRKEAVPWLKSGTILPLMWAEAGVDYMPDHIMSIMYHAHYTAEAVEVLFRWGSLVLFGFSLALFVRLYRENVKRLHSKLHRNVSGENPLIE